MMTVKVQKIKNPAPQGPTEEMVITLPIDGGLQPSTSGKTLSVASSHGNKPTGVEYQGREIIVGCNAYVYAKDKAAR